MNSIRTPARRRGRPSQVRAAPPRATLPDVPLWIVCTADEWLALHAAADDDAPIDAGRQLALHGNVAAAAIATFGAGVDGLIAIAIDARSLPGSCEDSPIRVDLGADGRARLSLKRSVGLAGAVVVGEPLRPDPRARDGYAEPTLRTSGDVARSQNRDAFRRTGGDR